MSSDGGDFPPVGGFGGAGAGFDDDSDAGPPAEADSLPEGIAKEILTEVDGYKRPKEGDEVSVHYVGTLASDGTEFDSSRKRDKPFVFRLGKGEVIKGWDLGVATMKKGELAKFTLAPEFGYGESGSPPDIPASATLVFEVELLSWMSKDDLFGDDGVIKTELQEGSGWRHAKVGDEVMIDLKATAQDGTAIEERQGFEYVLGSEALGPLGRAVDRALARMKRGEQASLRCSKDYAYGEKHPEGATLLLTLAEIYESKDVSFTKDASVMKKQIREPDSNDDGTNESPNDGATVKLEVSAATDGSVPLPGFTAQTLEFTLGSGEVCDALECAVAEMRRGERARVTARTALAADSKLGLGAVTASEVVMTVELADVKRMKETWEMSAEEKVAFGTSRKEVGSALLKAGRLQLALQRYEKVSQLFDYIDEDMSEENKAEAKALKQAAEANKAVVHMKLGNWSEVHLACDTVLKEDRGNVKAIYRRAQAQLHLRNFLDSIADCKKVIELDATNKEARALLKQAQAGQKEEDNKTKGLYANMYKALGKGPIPEPGKDKQAGNFDDSSEEEPLKGEEKFSSRTAGAGESKEPIDLSAAGA